MPCCHRKLRRCRRRNERLREDIHILEELLLINSGYRCNGLLGANAYNPIPYGYPYGAGLGLGYNCGCVTPPILL